MSDTHGKLSGAIGALNTSKIPIMVKTKVLVQQLIDKWVEAGMPLRFKIVATTDEETGEAKASDEP